ncbi:hypothetical protein [Streptomyces sp. NPDC048659]|uniref:hypothetical protein n=1 Tax=Streptomyces sp. NPDC048659 TaxID=3155489 RepID=UPI0034336656
MDEGEVAMANLHYEILTDPAQLQVSGTGKDEEAPGAVHIVVSNPNAWSVTLYELDITVPHGSGKAHLTAHPDRIQARLTGSTLTSSVGLAESWDGLTGIYRLEALSGVRLRKGEVLVVELSGFPVSSEEGLVLLSLAEDSHGRGPRSDHLITLSLLKRASKIPSNLRADSTLLGANEQVTLRWDGPDTLEYAIQGPVGAPHPVPLTAGPWHWSPPPGEEPKRDATYTLIATPKSPHQPGYYLTTTVHLRSPEFEGVTATDGVSTPWVKGIAHGGRVEFTDLGVTVQDSQGAPGTVDAKAVTAQTVAAATVTATDVTATNVGATDVNTTNVHATDVHATSVHATDVNATDVNATDVNATDVNATDVNATDVNATDIKADTVLTGTVRGRDAGAGWIRFPADGITVGRGASSDLGAVTAERVRVNGVNTTWVGDIDGGKGWIEFPQSGVNVRKDGANEWGTVAADKADLTGVNTSWVQGRTGGDGWIEFPAGGLNVFQGAGDRQWGTVSAGTADLNDLVTHRARVKERLHLEGGLTVDQVLETQDGPPRLIVHGRLDAEGDLLASQSVVVAGDLGTKGMLRVAGESRFKGKVNANGHLSVRNGQSWIMHTNDDQIAVQADLRVHGAFRSDS